MTTPYGAESPSALVERAWPQLFLNPKGSWWRCAHDGEGTCGARTLHTKRLNRTSGHEALSAGWRHDATSKAACTI
jgi:hypothetical protein